MVVLTRSSLPLVTLIWMSGTNLLQSPGAWFWKIHKWTICAALFGGRVNRIARNGLVFGPFLHRGFEPRSLRLSFWDSHSVCSSLFWGERWWSVGQPMKCVLVWVVSSSLAVEDDFLFIIDKSFDYFSLPPFASWSAASDQLPVCEALYAELSFRNTRLNCVTHEFHAALLPWERACWTLTTVRGAVSIGCEQVNEYINGQMGFFSRNAPYNFITVVIIACCCCHWCWDCCYSCCYHRHRTASAA